MKWMHIADLHVGKTLDAADIELDQRNVLDEIIERVKEEKPDGMLIAGDVYDRSVPSEKAVKLLDSFLTRLTALCPAYLISGNHDSGERLSFAGRLLEKQNLFISGGIEGGVRHFAQGDTDIYLMPYFHYQEARRVLGDARIVDTDSAVRCVLETAEPGQGRHRILVAHLFATANGMALTTSESESHQYKADEAGGLESVDVSAFDGFDYVALGHIHAPQSVGRETVRYCGTPMMYSFSEEHQEKSITVIDLDSDTPVRTIPLTSHRRMRTVTGLLAEMLRPGFDAGSHDDIIQANITDTVERPDARTLLDSVYKSVVIHPVGLMRNSTSEAMEIKADFSDPMALMQEFFKLRTDREMTPAELKEVKALMDEAEKEDLR